MSINLHSEGIMLEIDTRRLIVRDIYKKITFFSKKVSKIHIKHIC